MSFEWNIGVASKTARPAHRIMVAQGEHVITDDRNVVLSTVLGSCVAACIRDPAIGLGGMNHFVLPGPINRTMDRYEAARYGCWLMDALVSDLIKYGANPRRLEARIFGGASPAGNNFYNVGARNFDYARLFLASRNITVIEESMGGPRGCKLEYWPASGRADCVALPDRIRHANIEDAAIAGLRVAASRA
ncbi:chemotaxis protein CheD [Allorhizobium taibaishanense]|uniref:Probable chemoreceptor glutamine deamidase CheD n=1 Tax=Allorhizobium taibaishanense TaxID=887144 RepID=A0A1Q9A3C7_9HYPH|nr:chemotaxis protein CheD [Allorhizobium taibaishanense]MBB4005972.1 chemotaxis protein CheD [Allorhizobium taibaishanense]OLP48998.1 chemotaxis protein CheD [Allorhizobium taibaishanense]